MNSCSPEDLLNPDFHAHGDPYALWAWMRTHMPVFRHNSDDYPQIVSLTRFDDVRFAYSNPQIFSSQGGALLRKQSEGGDPGAGLALALTDPPKHRAIRSVMTPFFSGKAIKILAMSIQDRLQRLLNAAREKESINFSEDICAKLTFEITAEIMGIPDEGTDEMFEWLINSFHRGVSMLKHGECYIYMLELIQKRTTHPQEDLISHLIHAQTLEGRRMFSDLEVLLNCENLLGATENAGLTLAAAVSALLNYPDQRAELERDPSLLKSGLHELLRWTSSATHSMRTVTQSIELGGVELGEGDRVVLWIPSANRDPTVFSNPDVFDIHSRPSNAMALGAGEHVCIGGLLARLQLDIVLSELLVDGWKVERTGPETPLHSIAVNGPENFPVRIL